MEHKTIKHHAKHAGVDLLAGFLIGVFFNPKTLAGYALKGAIAGMLVYHFMHDSGTNSEPNENVK